MGSRLSVTSSTSTTNKPKDLNIVRLPRERQGESDIYLSPFSNEHGGAYFLYKDARKRTLWELFSVTAETVPNNKCLGSYDPQSNAYTWITYGEVLNRSKQLGSALVHHLGLKPHTDRIGIYSSNRVEWSLTEQAANAFSLCIVPLYDSLGREEAASVINDTKVSIIVCSLEKFKNLLEWNNLFSLKTVVTMGSPSSEMLTLAQNKNISIITFEELIQIGANHPIPVDPPTTTDMSTICFTSGSTGPSKGVILTHANIISNIAALIVGDPDISTSPGDCHISYLPMAHMFERVVCNMIWHEGGSIGFYSGDVTKLFENIAVLKPTVFCSVPRIWNRLYHSLLATGRAEFEPNMFNSGLEVKLAQLKDGHYTHSVWDNLIFNRFRQKLGGNVRVMITGAAPISSHVANFLKIAFCCPLIEGYGQTESGVAITKTLYRHSISGHVGYPLLCVQVKLVDIPELNAQSSSPTTSTTTTTIQTGELCYRGPSCTQGYHNNPEETKKLVDPHGWLHSGDIATIETDGTVRIVGRIKNAFKLSQGEYITPEPLEDCFIESEFIHQIFVEGCSLKSSLVAIVVPNTQAVFEHLKQKGHKCADQSPDVLLKNWGEDVNKLIQSDITRIGKENKLQTFKIPKLIVLNAEHFEQKGLLTPTLKLKRSAMREHFKNQLQEMYDKLD